MFNDVTVAMFKEWAVVKKNKYGKKQSRMLGVDLNRIYNSKVGEKAVKSKTLNVGLQSARSRSIDGAHDRQHQGH